MSRGIKISEQEYKLNKLDGKSISYYPNGNIKLECTYLQGILNGPMIENFENGNIRL